MPYLFSWRSPANVAQLEHDIDRLRSELIKLRRQLTNKTGYASRLEVLLRERLARIDELNGQLEQSRLKRSSAWAWRTRSSLR